jgi:hypothetical protein
MRVINGFAVALLLTQSLALASGPASISVTNPECLNHLGGGMSDVECYNGLANGIVAKNKALYAELLKTIPKHNQYAPLLSGYMKHVNESIKYCELARQSMNQWVTIDDTPTVEPHHDYDVQYYECVYEARKGQATYLKLLLDLEQGK